VDVIVREGTDLYPVEIKSSTTFNREFLKGCAFFKKICGDRCPRSFVIYGGNEKRTVGDTELIPYIKTRSVPSQP
jgi:hypothetical protein